MRLPPEDTAGVLVVALQCAHPEIAGIAAMQSNADPIFSPVENMVGFLSLLFPTLLVCGPFNPWLRLYPFCGGYCFL
ncbi:MAG: hypothetical protein JSU86_01885 [Phycisphaerales bacterium]|nr:MAG: hypothetical protein JSU86_01885 [Phycisphaerales bacterium]